MAVAVIYFILSAAVIVVAITAVRPPWTDKPAMLRPPWFPVMLANELAPLCIAVVVGLAVVATLLGARDETIGRLGLVASLVSVALFGWMIGRASRTGRTMRGVCAGSSSEADAGRIDLRTAFWPQPYRIPDEIDVTEDLAYMPGQAMDLYSLRKSEPTDAPVLIHIHGGSWSGGNRKQQARPLIHEMAIRGWVVASIDYPLAPAATFPEPIIAVHNAIGWIRSHADEWGIDPSLIYLTGGSSGAHLAALAALTDTDPEWSRRRESDPPIAGAVTFYGVFDLLNRHGIRDDWPIVKDGLMKADPALDPLKFRQASPIDRVRSDAPDFLIVHGDHDSLVPVEESVLFAQALGEVSENRVDLVRLKGATHAFDALPSVRTQLMVAAVADHLEGLIGIGRDRSDPRGSG